MADTTPTTATHHGDLKESDHTREQVQEDERGSSGPAAQQSNAASSGHRPTPGRRPLFGT
jgi:hypothetical protein